MTASTYLMFLTVKDIDSCITIKGVTADLASAIIFRCVTQVYCFLWFRRPLSEIHHEILVANHSFTFVFVFWRIIYSNHPYSVTPFHTRTSLLLPTLAPLIPIQSCYILWPYIVLGVHPAACVSYKSTKAVNLARPLRGREGDDFVLMLSKQGARQADSPFFCLFVLFFLSIFPFFC